MARTLKYADRMNARPTGSELGDWRKASRSRVTDWRKRANGAPSGGKRKRVR